MEEQPDLGVERRAARDHRLEPAAEACLDLAAHQSVEQPIHQVEMQRQPALVSSGVRPSAKRQVEHALAEPTLALDAQDDPLPQHLV